MGNSKNRNGCLKKSPLNQNSKISICEIFLIWSYMLTSENYWKEDLPFRSFIKGKFFTTFFYLNDNEVNAWRDTFFFLNLNARCTTKMKKERNWFLILFSQDLLIQKKPQLFWNLNTIMFRFSSFFFIWAQNIELCLHFGRCVHVSRNV